MDPSYIDKEKVDELLPMRVCIDVMEDCFRSLASGECIQPLRSLMWLPEKKGLLGMMPGHSEKHAVMGIKVISVFHANREAGLPSHQGVVILFDAKHGRPLMIFDAAEITAIRTAAASALATRLLSRENSQRLAIIGSGEQAERHIEAILLVRKIKEINCWSPSETRAKSFAEKMAIKYNIPVSPKRNVQEAVDHADIICTVTSSSEAIVKGNWISVGAHINAVGSCSPSTRELDTETILRSCLFTDCYESLFKEAGDFLIPKSEGVLNDSHVKGEIGEIILGKRKGREHAEEITLFKSLGIAAEDIFSAWHIYRKINGGKS